MFYRLERALNRSFCCCIDSNKVKLLDCKLIYYFFFSLLLEHGINYSNSIRGVELLRRTTAKLTPILFVSKCE